MRLPRPEVNLSNRLDFKFILQIEGEGGERILVTRARDADHITLRTPGNCLMAYATGQTTTFDAKQSHSHPPHDL